MRDRTEESFRRFRENKAEAHVAAQLATADAINRLADVVEGVSFSLGSIQEFSEALAISNQRMSTVAEIAGRMLTDPMAVVTMKRQIERIGKNLDKADEQHRTQEAKDGFARVLNMTDAELAS